MSEITVVGYIRKIVWNDLDALQTGVLLDNVQLIDGKLPPGMNDRDLKNSVFSCFVDDQTPGVKLKLSGAFEFNGRQYRFNATDSHCSLPDTAQSVLQYFASGGVPLMGSNLGAQLVNRYGKHALATLEESPETALLAMPGVTKSHVYSAIEAWKDRRHHQMASPVMEELAIPHEVRIEMIREWMSSTTDILKENPYAAAKFLKLPFDELDRNVRGAQSFSSRRDLKDEYNSLRLLGALARCLEEKRRDGHTAAPTKDVVRDMVKTLHVKDASWFIKTKFLPLVTQGLFQLHKAPDGGLVQLNEDDELESRFAKECWRRVYKSSPSMDFSRAPVIDRSPNGMHENQSKAVAMAIRENISIILGGPGTGKTTTVNSVLTSLKAASRAAGRKLKVLAIAPSGIAAERITQSTGIPAVTAHFALEAKVGGTFSKNMDNLLDVDVLVVDEFGMMGMQTAAALFEATPFPTKIIMLGDIDQIASVEPGNVLADMVDSGRIPTTQLTHDFRSSSKTARENAAAVREGRVIDYMAPGDGWEFRQCQSDLTTALAAEEVFERTLKLGDNPMASAILCSQHSGAAGTRALNARIQVLMQSRMGRLPFIEGVNGRLQLRDRVVQKENNRRLKLSNGQVGIVERVTGSGVVTNYNGRNVVYAGSDLGQLEPAWAISIHKSQGSEYKNVILPVPPAHRAHYTRQKLFTGITRMKSNVVVVGDPETYESAIHNTDGLNRHTGFRKHLERLMPRLPEEKIVDRSGMRAGSARDTLNQPGEQLARTR